MPPTISRHIPLTTSLDSFTLLESVMVLVILGILGIFAIPNLQDTTLQKAKDQIITDLRFTKNLAMRDDRQSLRDFNRAWNAQEAAKIQKILLQSWRLQFHTISNQNEGYIGTTYSIFAKRPRRNGSIDNKPMGYVSIARNPINGKCMSWYNYGDMPKSCRDLRDERLKLEERYHITQIDIKWNTKGCTPVNKTIYYDSSGIAYCGSQRLQIIKDNAIMTLRNRKGEALAFNLSAFL